jgi:hypothetical protein
MFCLVDYIRESMSFDILFRPTCGFVALPVVGTHGGFIKIHQENQKGCAPFRLFLWLPLKPSNDLVGAVVRRAGIT